jgi:N-sulfoglucosamine sulfohydrolase
MGLTHPPFSWDLNPSEEHMAGLFRRNGYETHLFGFQHVSPDARRLGFDGVHCDGDVECSNTGLGCNVSAELKGFFAEPRSGKPLYLEINLEEPHRPYDQGGAGPDDSNGVFVPAYLPDAPQSREEMAALQGAIKQADAAIGRLLGLLQKAKLHDNTIFVFVADHGIAMPRAKCTLYDAGIGVALILSWPEGGVREGTAVPSLVSNIDILPTLLDLIGAPVPGAVQGISMRNLLRGLPHVHRTEIFSEKTWHSYYDPMRSVRTERFKLIQNFETAPDVEIPADVEQSSIFRDFVSLYHSRTHQPIELYDLIADPWELDNLAEQPALTGVREELLSKLWDWMRDTGDPLLEGCIPSPARLNAVTPGSPNQLEIRM